MSVEVHYIGHLGNNLFEYALGRILAETHGMALRCIPAHEGASSFGKVEKVSGIVDRLNHFEDIFLDARQNLPGKTIDTPQLRYVLGEKQGWTGHGINFDYLLRNGAQHRIVLNGYFQRTEYYHPYRERIREWFKFKDNTLAVPLQPQDVVVHMRQSLDMFLFDRAIDLNYYNELLSGMSLGGKVYVCGLGLSEQVRHALATFKPVYLDLPAIDTLKLLTRANRIVMANSTFSWWGAYLSEAREIYFPRMVRNFWGKDRPDVSLEVPEERYRYIDDVAVRVWQPFRLNADVRLVLEQREGVGWVIGMGSGLSRTELLIPPELTGFAQWLTVFGETPFGMNEIHAHGLSAFGRRSAIKILLALQRYGALKVDSLEMSSLADFYGVRLE